MKNKLLRLLVAMVLLVSPLTDFITTVKAATTVTLTIHYHRADGNYDGWNLWVWPETKDGAAYQFQAGTDDFGKTAVISLDTDKTTFGFIVRLNEWEAKDIATDRFFDSVGGKAEIWLKSGDATVYTEEPDLNTDPTPQLGEVLLRMHYQRFDKNYTGWNVWLWQEGKDGAAFQFNGSDSFGMTLSTLITPEEGVYNLGFILRLNEWIAKDIDADRFINLSRAKDGVLDVWLVQGDSTVYYRLADVDLSPKFISASLDGPDMVKVKATVPIPLTNGKNDKIQLKNSAGEVQALRYIFPSEGTAVGSTSSFTLFTQDDLDLMDSYTISYPGYKDIPVVFSGIYTSEGFEEQFTYDGELGAIYTPTKTTFRLWAPTAQDVVVLLWLDGHTDAAFAMSGNELNTAMNRIENGTWELVLDGDFKDVYYTYLVTVNGTVNEAVDPYAKAVGVNGRRAMVVDLDSTDPQGWDQDDYIRLENNTDAILYELHIRDFSIDPDSGISAANKGKYLAFTEEGTTSPGGSKTGIDHLKELGVTHVHLLPSFDFRSIDETKLENNTFNWGYDPQHFNVPEGSYSSDPYDGNVRINEFKQMVMALHEAGIAVVMDVVYNHTGASADSDFSKIVPGYYYRYNAAGGFSNGSGTGNETASERAMMRRYIIDSVKYWVQEYHIDGFRFDLMALHDIETMAMLKDELEAINPNILIYGEGWTGGGSPLPDEEKALKKNVSQLNDIAVFSDDLRDAIKGHVFTKTDKGFVNGGQGLEESLKFGIVASTLHGQVDYPSVKYSKFAYATSPTQIVSYVEAHDNLTLWDKLVITNPDASVEQLIAMHRMANAIVLTSQGIPFIHAGAEFLRTKGGNENSYNAPDSVNRLDWSRKDEYQSNVDYIAGLIALRKAHPAFRMTTAADIKANLNFIETDQPNVVAYTLDNNANGDDWDTIAVLINANETEVQVTLEDSGWVVVVNGEKAGTTKLADIGSKTITIPAQTLLVLVDSDAYYGFNWTLMYVIGAVLLIGGGLAYYFLIHKKKTA